MRGRKQGGLLEPRTREIWQLAWPVMVGVLSHMVFHLVDLFWIGYLGAKALAAVAVAGNLCFVLWTVTGIIRGGGLALLSQAHGRKDEVQLGRAAFDTLLVALGLGLLVFLCARPLLHPFLAFFRLEPACMDLALRYLSIIILGVPCWYLAESAVAYFFGVGQTRIPMAVGVVANTVNMVLDPLLIFGWGPFPEMGIEGAAWATLAGNLVLVAGNLFFQVRRGGLRWRHRGLRPRTWLTIARIGLPGTLRDLSRPLVATVTFRFISVFGAAVVAAYGVSLRILGLGIVYIVGLNVALTSLTGQAIGRGEVEEVEETLDRGLRIGLFVHLVFTCLLWGLASPILSLFSDDGAVLAAGVPMVRIFCLGMSFVVVTRVFGAAFSGAGDTKPLMIASLTMHWLVQLPLTWLAAAVLAMPMAVWWGIFVARMGEALLLWRDYRSQRWKKHRVS